jgi:hypothetical protein
MADDEKDKNDNTESGTDDDKSKPFRLGDLRELIVEEVKKAVGTDTKAHDEAQKATDKGLSAKSDIASQVQEAIADIRKKEEREERDKRVESTLAELQKKVMETPPVERRKVHRFMGWGE